MLYPLSYERNALQSTRLFRPTNLDPGLSRRDTNSPCTMGANCPSVAT
jgi:hypothetical protein